MGATSCPKDELKKGKGESWDVAEPVPGPQDMEKRDVELLETTWAWPARPSQTPAPRKQPRQCTEMFQVIFSLIKMIYPSRYTAVTAELQLLGF